MPRRNGLLATVKLAAVAAFVWITNSGIHERALLLADQERYRGLVLYAGLWGACIGCLLLVAFHPHLRWRLLWSAVIAATTFVGYAFLLVTDSHLTVFHIISMWTALADAGRAASHYSSELATALAVAAFGFAALVAPVRIHPRLACATTVMGLAPAVPMVALAAMITVRIGDDTVAMPQQFAPAAIGAVAAAKLATHEPPVKSPLAADPVRPAQARHVVVLMDESVTSQFVSFDPDSPVTPFLAGHRHLFVDFGQAASASNCSGETNAIIRYGGGRDDLRRSMSRSPYLWDFARRAGFRTVFIDAAASHIKNPSQLQNYMTLREKALIDEFILIDDGPGEGLDLALSATVAQILERKQPHFIYANKNGAHFPYDKAYPAGQALFRPTESDGAGASSAHQRLNSYRNAVHWSVDRFFADFIGRADLSHAAIIYTSDHGQNLAIGSATHCSHQSAHPDEGRVPLFALTGIEPLRQQLADAGRVNFGRASHFALFPTLIELFGYRSGDFAHGYGRSLFEEIEQAQDFVSGDIMGIFSDQLWWTPIAGREVEMAAPSPVVR